MSSLKTSLIIPAYFADESFVTMTQECLDSLQDRPDEVILVNDGSSYHMDRVPRGVNHYIFLPENKGYAAAVNAGLTHAVGDIIVIANNDMLFTPGWLEAIMKPLTLGYDISSIRTSDNGWELEDKITEGDKFGSIFAMTRAAYQTLGDFDETFRGYFTDLDYRRRALNAGLRIGKNHNHLVEHLAKATYGVTDPEDKEYEAASQLYLEKWGALE